MDELMTIMKHERERLFLLLYGAWITRNLLRPNPVWANLTTNSHSTRIRWTTDVESTSID